MGEATEAHVGARVGQMEGQFFVAEPVHLLENGGTQDLLGRQSGASEPGRPASSEVFPGQARQRRVVAEDAVDGLQLAGVLVGQWRAGKQIEVGNDWAHPGAPLQAGPFLTRTSKLAHA